MQKKDESSAPSFRRHLKRRVVNPTRFQRQSMHASWRLMSPRQRLESSLQKDHEDHIAGKGFNSMTHYNLVHKFILLPQTMKIPDVKVAVDKEWKKLETNPAWQLDRVRSKKEVILGAQRDKWKVHFATLVDICHLTNAELEPTFQNTEDESCSEVTFQKTSLEPMQSLLNRARLRPK